MSQETINGIFYLALPESTLILVKTICEKTEESIGDCISNSIMQYAIQKGAIDASQH